jgi:hypothetical protein
MNKRECPYCDHLNLANAKFCTACGAAMHLAPCPHCGAVNDISATGCYRCHGELTPPAALLDASAGEEGVPSSEQAGDGGPQVDSVTATEPPSTRPSLLVIGIILLAFAAASYYAFRQRSTMDARAKTAPVVAPAFPAVETSPPKTAPAPANEPVVPAATTPPAPVEPATAPPVVKPAPLAAKPAPVIVKQANPPVKAPTATNSAPPKGPTPATISPPATPVAPPSAAPQPVCTEAVAALGLCKPDSKASDAK